MDNLAIGCVQSMAVVINVMCILKDVGGDELTAVQGASTLAIGPLYLLSTPAYHDNEYSCHTTLRDYNYITEIKPFAV